MSSWLGRGPRWAWVGGAAVLCGAGLWWLGLPDTGAAGPSSATADAQGPALVTRAPGSALTPSALSAAPSADIAAATAASQAPERVPGRKISVEELLKTGSLRGTQMDGDWGQLAGDALNPSLRLRQRFEYLLVGLGEVDEADIRAWIAEQARAAHGDKGAVQVLAVWDAYIALQRAQVGGKAADPADALAWQRWLAERSAARSKALGPAWAEAFFGEEDRNLQEFGERMVQRAAAPPEALEPESAAQKILLPSAAVLDSKALALRQTERVKHFGDEGAQRLAAEDKAWAEWSQRIEAARMRHQEIAFDKQLSAPQRQQALEADLAKHFQGVELVRARGLVGS